MDLKKTLFVLPNLFTLSSIFCGFDAIRLVAGAQPPEMDATPYHLAALLLVFAMFFDTIDGRVARLTRTESAFGVQIDSLADVISFGVGPALLVYRWALRPLGHFGLVVSFVFLAAGAIRLARFNVLSMNAKGAPHRPSKFIVGLPIPGAAGVILALVIANHSVAGNLFRSSALIAALTLGLSGLMVSTVPFRSFKNLRLNARTITLLSLGLGSTALVASRFGLAFALPWILAVYITIALVEAVLTWPRRRREKRALRRTAGSPTPPER